MKRSFSWFVVAALAVALLGLWMLSRKPKLPTPESLPVAFIAFTNPPIGNHPVALFVLTNRSDVDIKVASLLEVKTGGRWPEYGPDMRPYPLGEGVVLVGGTYTFTAPVPDYGIAWHVSLTCSKSPTLWESRRSRWESVLLQQKLYWLARLMGPSPKQTVNVVTPELKPRVPGERWRR